MIAKERIYLNAERTKALPEGHKDAAFLYATPGDEIPESAVELLGLVDGGFAAGEPAPKSPPKPKASPVPKVPAPKKAKAAKASPPPATKEAPPQENKEAPPADDKSGTGGQNGSTAPSGQAT